MTTFIQRVSTAFPSVLSAEAPQAALPALERIHAEHAGAVWLALQRLGVREADLEDALQEVFVVVHRRLHTYDREAKLSSWLFGIAIKVAAGFRRKAYNRYERVVADHDESRRDPSHGPEAAALDAEARRDLAKVLDTLDPRQRAVLVMFEIEGLATGDIAEALGVPVGTVHSRLHAARRAFADAVRRLQARRARKP